MKCIPIQGADTDALRAIASIAAQTLGANYLDVKALTAIVEDPRYQLWAAMAQDKPVGFGTAMVADSAETGEIWRRFKLPSPDLQEVGWLKSLGVDPAWQRRGVGKLLVSARLDWLSEVGCNTAFAVSWDHPGNNSKLLLQRFGFEAVAFAPNYYAALDDAYDYTCPICKQPPCRCAAYLLVKWSL